MPKTTKSDLKAKSTASTQLNLLKTMSYIVLLFAPLLHAAPTLSPEQQQVFDYLKSERQKTLDQLEKQEKELIEKLLKKPEEKKENPETKADEKKEQTKKEWNFSSFLFTIGMLFIRILGLPIVLLENMFHLIADAAEYISNTMSGIRGAIPKFEEK